MSAIQEVPVIGSNLTAAARAYRLDGKVAVITGGCGGIGSVVSQGLAELGAKIAISDWEADKAAAFSHSLSDQGYESHSVAFNVLSVSDTQRMFDDIAEHYGKVDILVNCVGTQKEEPAEEVTEEAFDKVYNVNLKGAMFQAQAAARHMIKQGTGGKQVHMGSVRSELALRGRGYAAYCATKGGLGILCKQLAAEWAPYKINVNVVAPTFVRTPLVESMLSDPTFYNQLVSRIPLGRLASPQDVMSAIAFLVSPASDFITGQKLFLDGGLTATQ
jgi:NAD(P)-dependent dehydrogenase (short-subunit alcohol dehydrogenase family)